MSRRIRTTAAPSAAPRTVRIPRQRGRQAPQVIVVVSEEPTLTARATAATGRWLWRHRRAWAPTGIGALLLALTGVVHLFAPWAAFIAAPAGLAPLAFLGWKAKTSRTKTGMASAWRTALTVLALAALAWFCLALWSGPASPALMGLWTLTTLAAQVMWLIGRRRSTSTPSTTATAPEGTL
ncbi:hypothetical protein MTF65_13320 [Streptomyces sp. APSN-46.1]|uniref:hypothetical protein n=1 Tax=Streptomyces sp. APSN-46.1 TaxID=2929049 RepID=UPI001FB228CC|nr:hypothetical protein [Streptomyces sp. APSN-46.1]MCJ1678309.1 hypothetical protein [Streptomyces sp. APSN-46.1]